MKNISINIFTLQIGDAFHLVKEPVEPAINVALETLEEFNLINAMKLALSRKSLQTIVLLAMFLW